MAGCPADPAARRELESYEGDFDSIIAELKPKPAPKAPTGWQLNQPFKKPDLTAINLI